MGRSNPSKSQRAARRQARETTLAAQDETERIFAFGEFVLTQTLAAVGAAHPRPTDPTPSTTTATPPAASRHGQTDTQTQPRPDREILAHSSGHGGRVGGPHHQFHQTPSHPLVDETQRAIPSHPRPLAERITLPPRPLSARIVPPPQPVSGDRPLAERISLPPVSLAERITFPENQQQTGSTGRRRRRRQEERENSRHQPYRR
jgi:hypothetical protein